MKIIVRRDIPESLVSHKETWEAQNNLEALFRQRPRRKRDRVYPYNDKYGFGACIRHYAGLSEQKSLHGILPHGILPYGPLEQPAAAPKQELLAHIPCIFASNDRCKEAFWNAGKRFIFPIGLASNYAAASLIDEIRDSKGSIFFRSHSTPAFTDTIDDHAIIHWLKDLPDQYKPIRISAFPHDWKRGAYKTYLDADFQLISAGNPYDPAFIWRHLHLIRSHRYTLSTGMGTHIFHATICGKPALIKSTHHDYLAHKSEFSDYLIAKDSFQNLCKHYFSPSEEPTAKQIQLANEYLGSRYTLPPQDLRKILELAEILHHSNSPKTNER